MERPAIPFIRLFVAICPYETCSIAEELGLSIQFVKQGFCLAERRRIEAFREPAVDFGEQALRLGSAALGFEPSREGRCPLQLVVLCALDARAFQRSAIGGLDR